MKKEYWKIGLAAAFLAVAGFCYGFSRWQQGTLLPQETQSAAMSEWSLEAQDIGDVPDNGTAADFETADGGTGAQAGTDKEALAETVLETEAAFYVHVCGEVRMPGVYMLPADSRIFEAIDAAGGFTEEAAEEVLNLAGRISDGMQIVVLSRKEAEALPPDFSGNQGRVSGTLESKEASGRVNLNTAAKEELMTLNGIGESKAEDIIRYREENGGFAEIEDIMKVPGIKSAGFQKIKDSITV